MVLNDGETYTDAKGCLLMELKGFEDFEPDDVPDHDIKNIAHYLSEGNSSIPMEDPSGFQYTARVIARF